MKTPHLRLVGLALVAMGTVVSAQGHSALRDPKRSVFASFPEADGYRAIVRPVGKAVRANVQEDLPFKIHFNELGDHTVYAALRGRRPLGLVHARTEEGRWGLIEIEWCLSLDLTIRDMKLHRCRSAHRRSVQESAFTKSLIGRDVGQLARLIDADGRVNPKAGTVPTGAEELASTVLKSAIKTLILTRSAWRSDIERLRDLDLGLRAFPEGAVIRRLLPRSGVVIRSTPRIRSTRALLVRDGRGRPLGRVASTQIAFGAATTRIEWTIGADGRIRRVEATGPWQDTKTRADFERLEGRILGAIPRAVGPSPAGPSPAGPSPAGPSPAGPSPAGNAEETAAALMVILSELKEPGVK